MLASALFVTKGKLAPLAGVYTISFLLVMAFFALGNLILKIRRSRLPRPEYARLSIVLLALFVVAVALYGNVKMRPQYLVVFLQYFLPAMLLIYAMLNRIHIMKFGMDVLKNLSDKLRAVAVVSRKKKRSSRNFMSRNSYFFPRLMILLRSIK